MHYRGYDILDIATQCEFEEIAHLLVHEKLPNRMQLAAYKKKLKGLRVLPAGCDHGARAAAGGQPSDGRVAHRRLGAGLHACPNPTAHKSDAARDLADRLLACLGSMLCYWYHYSKDGRRIDVQTDDDSIGAHFLHLLHGRETLGELGCARCTHR